MSLEGERKVRSFIARLDLGNLEIDGSKDLVLIGNVCIQLTPYL